jgi:hypothetical protein
VVVAGAVFFYFWIHDVQLWILLLIAIFGFAQTIGRFASARSYNAYYKIAFTERVYVTIVYFGLAAALVLGMVATQRGFFL